MTKEQVFFWVWACYLLGCIVGWFMSRKNLKHAESKGYARGVQYAESKSWRPLIEELTDEEGATVTICAPNAEFEGPSHCIEVNADWTSNDNRPFYGESVTQCLRIAIVARNAHYEGARAR